MRIQPIVPYYYIAPPMRKKDEPEEPVSFCGHLHRLMLIQQKHLMLQRLWALMTDFLHPQPHRFNRIA